MSIERRKLVFHGALPADYNKLIYDTDIHGPWTLNEWSLSAPVRQTNIVTIPGRDGEIDLAPALGDIRYEPRDFYAALECSDGTRDQRTALIEDLMNTLEGRCCQIILPDDPLHYIKGYIDVEVEYNDVNHARVLITSRVDPWRYALQRVDQIYEATAAEQVVIIKNMGGRKVVPRISAWTRNATMPNITIEVPGIYEHTFTTFDVVQPEELTMRYKDEFALTYSGTGFIEIMWTEASL